ncbi:MAG: hypothetical protein AAFP90_10500 [Planctomycetota bacterium]
MDEPLPVSHVGAGRPEILQQRNAILPVGTRLGSYFVHLVTPQEIRPTDGQLQISGTLRFDQPILAFITDRPSLTTSLLGNPATAYAGTKTAGLEDAGDHPEFADTVTVSSDRKLMRFTLHVRGKKAAATPDFIDQIRVLVQAAD